MIIWLCSLYKYAHFHEYYKLDKKVDHSQNNGHFQSCYFTSCGVIRQGNCGNITTRGLGFTVETWDDILLIFHPNGYCNFLKWDNILTFVRTNRVLRNYPQLKILECTWKILEMSRALQTSTNSFVFLECTWLHEQQDALTATQVQVHRYING